MNARVKASNVNAVGVDRLVMPHAGHYNDCEAYNCDTEKLDKRKVKIKCPNCERISSPLCSSKTKLIRQSRHGAEDWCDIHTLFETQCRCGQEYQFTVITEC